jgi:hypothetical protein
MCPESVRQFPKSSESLLGNAAIANAKLSHRSFCRWVDRIEEKVHLNRPSKKALDELDTHLGEVGSESGPMGKTGIVGTAGAVVMTDDPRRDLKEKTR